MTARDAGRVLAHAALLVAVVTIVARLVGFGRGVVLARAVGPTCLADTYLATNTIPNVVFEIVAGGALASLVVPVLARWIDSGDRATADRISSALLTWSVVLLVPVMLLVLVLARPIVGLLVGGSEGGCDPALETEVGARMLRVFAPQVVLYGVGIVLTGILQAHRRFLGPAVAPLLSSVVVIGAYLVYAAVAATPGSIADLSRTEELVLSVGTTLGVVALSLSLLVPLRAAGVRFRPTLGFPPGVAAAVRRLAVAGITVLVAQQLSVVVALRLAWDGPEGSVVVFNLAQTMFLLPWAVLAVPIATTVFPTLSSRSAAGDLYGYATAAAGSVRAVVLGMVGAAAVVAVAAEPVARVLVLRAPGRPSVEPLTDAIVAFAPGLVGYGLVALVARALYARDAGRAAAIATAAGWAAVVVADVVLVAMLPDGDTPLALAAGNSIGMTVAGVLLLLALVRSGGRASTAGLPRAFGASLAAAAVAVAVGLAGSALVEAGGVGASLVQGTLLALVTGAVFAGVVALLDRRDVSTLLAAGRLRG